MKIFSAWLSCALLMCLFLNVSELQAKSASGGGGKVEIAEPEPEPAPPEPTISADRQAILEAEAANRIETVAPVDPVPAAEPVVEAPPAVPVPRVPVSRTPVKELDKSSPKIAEAAPDVDGDGDVEVEARATVPVCANKEDLRERIECRLAKTEAELQIELTPENYQPEGCRWGSDAWRENCKNRYRAIHDHYSLPIGAPRMEAIKAELGLEAKLKPASVQCPDGDDACKTDYRKKIEHLIVARFYDAEERAEELYELGRLSEDDLVELITLISESKVEFYDATKYDDRVERQRGIITRLRDAWNGFMQNLN